MLFLCGSEVVFHPSPSKVVIFLQIFETLNLELSFSMIFHLWMEVFSYLLFFQ